MGARSLALSKLANLSFSVNSAINFQHHNLDARYMAALG
jgi:hypothetical protein